MSLETQLRDALAARANHLDGPAFEPYERVTGAVVTSRRRRRAAALGAVAAVAAVAVLVPSLSQGDHGSTLPAKRTQVVVPGPNDPRWGSVSTWPVRGSLAADQVFVDSVGQKFADAHVLYAADLPTSRVVVSYNPSTDGVEKLTMYSGPRGAAAADLAEVSSMAGGLEDVVSIREHADNDSTLVVLTRPGLGQAGISRSVQIATDGSVQRDAFRAVALTDGVYSEVLQDSPPSLTRVAVDDAGKPVTGPGQRVTLMGRQSLNTDDHGSVCLNCTGEDFRVKAEEAMGGGVAATLGLSPKDVSTSTVFYGTVDRALADTLGMGDSNVAGSTVRLMVADSRLPQGQVLRSALLVVTAKDGSAASTNELANGVPIDASSAAVRPFVLRSAESGVGTLRYEVFAPRAATVQLVSSSPSIYPSTARIAVTDGVAVATTPTWGGERSAYDIEAFDSSGRSLGRWPVDLPSEDEWTAGATP